METRNWHLLKLSLLANSFELYEYSIFGFVAGLMAKLFCDAAHPMTALIQGWLLFATSYLARPLGALCFGRLGSRIGHGNALKTSLLLMAIPTACIGILPTYPQAGWLGLYLLVSLRLIQGFAAGGELSNTACYVFETASPQYRSLLCSVLLASGSIGILLSSSVTLVLERYFTPAELMQGAWRLPFLLSIPLTLFIGYIRYTILDSPAQLMIEKEMDPPLSALAMPLLKGFILVAFESVGWYLLYLWIPTYNHYFLGLSSEMVYFAHSRVVACSIPLYFMGGYMTQRFGYTKLVIGGTVSLLLISLPVFQLLQLSTQWYHLFALQALLLLAYVPMHSTFIETLVRLFPPKARSLGVSLALSIPAAYIGSTTPLVCTYMIHKTGIVLLPAFYMIVFGCLALPIVLRLK